MSVPGNDQAGDHSDDEAVAGVGQGSCEAACEGVQEPWTLDKLNDAVACGFETSRSQVSQVIVVQSLKAA
jgi:hypothetical protein